MATIMEIINSFDSKSKEYEDFIQDFITLNGDIPFDAEEIENAQSSIIAAINGRLNQSHTRYIGLVILDKILPQCSKEVLLKYGMLWIGKGTQVLDSIHSDSQELTLACKVLGQLIIRSKDIPEIQKQISMQNVKQLVAIIGNLDSDRMCGAVYYLIAVLLHRYPEICERHQVTIRKVILLQMDSTNYNLVRASANCYVLLVKAVERSFKPPAAKPTYTNWVYNQALICNSLHVVMDELFSNLIELESVEIWDKLELPSITQENAIEFYSKQKYRFMNLCSYLSCMLCGYDKKNFTSPHDILRVVCRGLAVQPPNLKDRSTFKEQMVYLVLPKLHIALFTVLEALINGFKAELIPFGSTILQLFRHTLQWTETVLENQTTISGSKPFRDVRISLYKCLSSWLMNTNTLSGIETVADEYLPSILKDIVPERDRVLLTIQKTQNLSKRALKRLRDSQYEKSAQLNNAVPSKKQVCLDVDICKEALVTLQNFFFSGGSWLKQTLYKTVQNIVVPLLYDCYLSSAEQKFYMKDAGCRVQLLRVLRALQLNPHSLIPAPTQYSLEIFEMALNDTDFYVTLEAKLALAELEKIIHPMGPTLQLVHVEELQKEFNSTEQDNEHGITLEGTINENGAVDEDTIPSLSKKLRLSNSLPDMCVDSNHDNNSTIELCANQINQDTTENLGDIIAMKEKTISEDTGMVEDEEHDMSCANQTLNKTIPATIVSNRVETMENKMKPVSRKSGTKSVEKNNQSGSLNMTEEININLEKLSKESEDTETRLLLDETAEEEDILRLFQDKPKNDN